MVDSEGHARTLRGAVIQQCATNMPSSKPKSCFARIVPRIYVFELCARGILSSARNSDGAIKPPLIATIWLGVYLCGQFEVAVDVWVAP